MVTRLLDRFMTKRAVRKTLRIAIESIPPPELWHAPITPPVVDWEYHVGKYLNR